MPVLRIYLCLLIFSCSLGCPTAPTNEPETPTPAPGLGLDPSIPAASGEARGGVLPSDPAAFAAAAWGGITAEARPGDLVVYNDRVRFAVRREDGHGYVGIAGSLIDADIVRPEGQLGRDTLEEAFLAFGIGRVAGADSVELAADGSDGGPAIIRVIGTDESWTFVEGVTESDGPIAAANGLTITTDYILEPDSSALLIRTTLANPGPDDVRVNPLDGLIAAREDLAPYGSDEGLSPGALEEPPGVGVVGRHGEATMLLYRADGPLDKFGAGDLLSSSGIELLAHGWRDIPPGQETVLERYRAVGPDPASVEAARYEAQGVETATLSGLVQDSNGTAVQGARVHLIDDSGESTRFLGFALTKADGGYTMSVPPGDYTAIVTGNGTDEYVDLPAAAGRYAPFSQPSVNAHQLSALRGESSPVALVSASGHADGTPSTVSIPENGTTLDLVLPAASSLAVSVTSGGNPVAAYIEVAHTEGPPDSPIDDAWRAGLGLPARTTTAMRVWTADGDVSIPLPPGDYELTVSASHRHSRETHSAQVTTTGGSTSVNLEEVIPRNSGYLAMDSHLHAAPSTDGSLPMEDRLVVCAAAGVELPVTTDHDRMVAYGPLVPALGLEDTMTVIDGVEVSSVLRGHFNLFPAPSSGPSVPNGGAPAWWMPLKNTDELLARMRKAAPEGAFIQVNHGRESPSGMMSAGLYEPETGEPFRPDYWSWNFDLVEIVNGKGQRSWEEPRADWFSWLNYGHKRIPIGVSDSHGRTSGCGYGRTEVMVGTDVASEVTPEILSEAIRQGRVIVAGGVSLLVNDGTNLPGSTKTGDTISLAITVLGPEWARPDVVRVIRYGETVLEEVITGPSVDGVWWSGTFEDVRDSDAWYVVEVQGSDALGGPYGSALPYALSNAFFLDTAGDGWNPAPPNR